MRLPTAEEVWHELFRRASAERIGDPAHREYAHDLVALSAHMPTLLRIHADGAIERVPNAAAGDVDATRAAMRAALDRWGEHLGIGPRPADAVSADRREIDAVTPARNRPGNAPATPKALTSGKRSSGSGRRSAG